MVEIYKNKRGKRFIYIGATSAGWARFIMRDGRVRELELRLFERDEEADQIISDENLIYCLRLKSFLTPEQLKKWQEISENDES